MALLDTPALPMANRRFTAADLARVPDSKHYELVDGELVEREMSVGAVRVAGNIFMFLRAEALRTAEATAYPGGLGYRGFPDDPERVRRPDASVVRGDRGLTITDEQPFIDARPDLAVEVISPTDVSYSVFRKVHAYLAVEFPLVWVVDPLSRTVTVYRPDRPAVMLSPGQSIDAEPALAEFRCDVAACFERACSDAIALDDGFESAGLDSTVRRCNTKSRSHEVTKAKGKRK